MRVWHYDGNDARRRHARVEPDGDLFLLVEADRTTGPFAWRDLVAGEAGGDGASYGLRRLPGWRIGFADGVPDTIAARLPRHARYGGVVDRLGLWPAAGVFALLAAIAVTLALRTPALVARLVPVSVERRLGDAMVGDFGRSGCEAPAGKAALAALVRRIDPDDAALDVRVVKVPLVNAVTLPGRRIVIFDELLQEARSPDEVAGVIGHELGHVRHRDVTTALIRQLGLSVLLGGLEGHVGGYTNALLALTYSRGVEVDADGFAIERLKAARISPAATVGFFRRLAGKSGRAERMFAYVASHPVSSDRARRFAASTDRRAAYRPALDAAQWQALRDICEGAPEQSVWRF